MTTSDINKHVSSLAAFPALLRERIEALDDATLRYKPENEWSAIENLGHLIDIERAWMRRFQLVLSAERPAFPPMDFDQLVRSGDYQHKDPATLLGIFVEARAETIAFFRELTPTQRERSGVHPVRGEISITETIGILANHDRLHTEQIANTVAEATHS